MLSASIRSRHQVKKYDFFYWNSWHLSESTDKHRLCSRISRCEWYGCNRYFVLLNTNALRLIVLASLTFPKLGFVPSSYTEDNITPCKYILCSHEHPLEKKNHQSSAHNPHTYAHTHHHISVCGLHTFITTQKITSPIHPTWNVQKKYTHNWLAQQIRLEFMWFPFVLAVH